MHANNALAVMYSAIFSILQHVAVLKTIIDCYLWVIDCYLRVIDCYLSVKHC